ncbi:MAG: Na/Pi cotransporter family protein [Lachnospiraceae bacterium]|nr:Na/Pi cotransporter family protein [Lachnospiraceae bacterium]MBR5916751.1 Na/Pi cotransporter family protein [Lachnospiraceae bacterium]
MYFFNVISLLGGLALFLYGMRLMGNSLKEGQSGTLKVIMGKVTDNPVKAFLLGLLVTAVIQSSTATIVITSGLVAAGIISLNQSLGIIVGANVGTTVTGQIIRLLDVNGDSFILRLFQPSTLAPIALILGITFIMFIKFKKSDNIGNIAVGFGILFTGLLNMTAAVSGLKESGIIDALFLGLGNKPVLGYIVGAGVAFTLQSSSATIGILQAISMAGDIPFKVAYVIIVGVYLGDCVTTAIVCSIGAKSDSKRVGLVNIMYNLAKTLLVIIVVFVVHKFGLLDNLWDKRMTSGTIANTNTVFNLACAIIMLPFMKLLGNVSRKVVKDKVTPEGKYDDKIAGLNPVFFNTPAIAFGGCYDCLDAMIHASNDNIVKSIGLVRKFDEKVFDELNEEEENIDHLTDCVDTYLVNLSPHVKEDIHVRIMTEYHRVVKEFERLGDHAVNIAEDAKELSDNDTAFSEQALGELDIAFDLMKKILNYTIIGFERRDIEAAKHIEPLEEVMDDLTNTLHDNHLARLREGNCSVQAGIVFLDILANMERIADICSNIGIAIIARKSPEAGLAHTYVSALHQGGDSDFNDEYIQAHSEYFGRLSGETPE